MEIKALMTELKNHLTTNHLQELTLNILEAKKENNHRKLQFLHQAVFNTDAPQEMSGNRIFLKLVNFFHPDRLALLTREIQEAADGLDVEKLRFYRKVLMALEGVETVRLDPVRHSWEHSENYDFTEEYGYSEPESGTTGDGDGDGSFDDEAEYSSDFDDTLRRDEEDVYEEFFHESTEEMNFVQALKAEYLGVLDVAFTPADLASLTEEVDLADYGIADLDGLDYCRGISLLNLSENRISNVLDLRNLSNLKELYLTKNHISDITPLAGLTNLEVLDLSFNEIDDITPLLSLSRLTFLNLLGNPRPDGKVIRELKSRGVVILTAS